MDDIKALLCVYSIHKMMEGVEQMLLQGRDLTPDQWKHYQQRISGEIDHLGNEIMKAAKQLTEIKPGDSVEEKSRKISLHNSLFSLLEAAVDDLKRSVTRICNQVGNGIKWCWEKLKEAYSSFKRLFN